MTIHHFADLAIDESDGTVSGPIGKTMITKAELHLLLAFAAAGDRIVEADELCAAMRASPDHPVPSQSNMRVVMSRLRRELRKASPRIQITLVRRQFGWRVSLPGSIPSAT